ncbi:MAG: glyoxalase [Actinobacteria bacterium RBG_16_67_15]|nr:MAG: glyoxalase [Actinobacteria bacterium RBG_16_67_15]
MKVLFISGFATITADPKASARFYVDTLGLPLQDDDGYRHSNEIQGAKHFGIWPLSAAAQSCFGTDQWPKDTPVPTATIDFDVDDVAAAAAEMEAAGYTLIHPARTEPWGQTVARVLSPEGVLVGLSYAPWFRE